MRSAYDILGLAAGASDDDISGAYRRYSKVLHPDVNKRKTAAVEFKELKSAYDTLRDPERRREHDYALAVIETRDVERDVVDDVLDEYSVEVKKKKKKKKKKQKSAQAESQAYPQNFSPPPYQPPPQQYRVHGGSGNGQFEGIPDGYENFDSIGGIL